MTLKDNLYKLQSADTDAGKFDLALLPDSVIYRAHFPGMPITPGVCIIQIATELLQQCYGLNAELATVANAKFLSVINPVESPEVTYKFTKLTYSDDRSSVKAAVTVSAGDTAFTKLSLLYNLK